MPRDEALPNAAGACLSSATRHDFHLCHNTLYTPVTLKLSFAEKLLHSIYVLSVLPGITTVPLMTLYSSFCKIC